MKRTKRRFAVCFAALLLLFAAWTVSAAAEKTVYLDAAHGSDRADGTSASAPLASLDAAFAAVRDGGRIVLLSDYTIRAHYTEPQHDGEVVITAADGGKSTGAKLVFDVAGETHYRLSGATTFRDLDITLGNFVMFTAQFHSLTFDTGLSVENGEKYAFVVGGYQTPESADLAAGLDAHITIRSGAFYKLCGFTRTKGAGTMTYTGTAYVTVEGGSVRDIYGGSLYNHYAGSAVLTVSGGSIATLSAGGDGTRRLNGDAKVTVSGGTVGSITVNNVVGNAAVTLTGGNVGSLAVSYAADAVRKLHASAGAKNTLALNPLLYTAAQREAFAGDFDSVENLATVYVAPAAFGSGLREDDPTSLSRAVELLRDVGGKILVRGKCYADLAADVGSLGGGVTVCGTDGGMLNFGTSASLRFAGDLTFENITLRQSGTLRLTVCDGTLTMGGGVTVAGGSVQLAGAGTHAEIAVKTGSYDTVTVGTAGGDYTLHLTGGSIDTLHCAGQTAAKSVTVSVAGGSVTRLAAAENCASDALGIALRGGSVGTVSLAAQRAEVTLELGAAKVGMLTVASYLAKGTLLTEAGADQALTSAVAGKFAHSETANVIYLADGGKGDGRSASSPVGDLNHAIALLGGDGTVVVCGRYTPGSAYTVRTQTGKLTLTAKDRTADYRARGACIVMNGTLTLGGETRMESLAFEAGGTSTIYAKGYPLTVGDDVDTTLTDGNAGYISLVGGHNLLFTSYTTSLTVNSGNWFNIRAGYNTTRPVVRGIKSALTINGGTVHGYVAGGSRGSTSGSVSITVNGGELRRGIFGLYEEDGAGYRLNYDVTVTINGGVIHGAVAPAKGLGTTLHGSFTLHVAGGSFGHLTDLSGAQNFGGDMTSTLHVADSVDLDRKESGTVTFTNYLRQNNADPYIFYYNGFYYYTCTGATTINLMKVANIADIKTAAPYTILESTEGKNFWSPEIHYFSAADVGAANAGWYMFIAYDDGTTANQRQHVVKCLDGDNLLGRWGDPVTGEVNKPRRLNFASHPEINRDMLCGGTSVIRIGGVPYLTYVSEEGRGTADFHQTINIIRFENPWTAVGDPTIICVPEYKWEMGGYGESTTNPGSWYPKVVEGAAAVYGENGEVYLMYTGSGYWTVYYQLGYLKFTGGDPLDAKNWVKNPEPVFSRSDTVNGCGHASYMTDADGTNWACYHAYLGKDTSSKRNSFIEPYYVSADGVAIGNRSGHPAPLDTVYTTHINKTPLRAKISGFDRVDAK